MQKDEKMWVIFNCAVCGAEIQGIETQSGAGWVVDHVVTGGQAWCANCYHRRTGHKIHEALHEALRSRPIGLN